MSAPVEPTADRAVLEPSRVQEIAAQIIEAHGRTSISSFIGRRVATILNDYEFTEAEWDKVVLAVREAIKTAVVSVSWPEPEAPSTRETT